MVQRLAGSALSLLAIACSIIPPPEVTKFWLFEGNLALGTFAAIASGWLLYRRSNTRTRGALKKIKTLKIRTCLAELRLRSPSLLFSLYSELLLLK